MHLLLVGISHRTAPVELRERVDFQARGVADALGALAARGSTREAVVLSTCNRAELYVACDEALAHARRPGELRQRLPRRRGGDDLRRTSTTSPISTPRGICSASPPASTRSSSASRRFSDR